MREFHAQLAAIGLRAVEKYGFVLAGGYAISANGFGDRLSMDVDLFTNSFDPARFADALADLRAGFAAAGFQVEDKTLASTFADLVVTDPTTGEYSPLQLGANYREFPPTRIALGPVLDVRDAVAGKISALWSRGYARDFIDIDTVIASGRFTRDEVLAIGDQQEALPMDREILAGQFRSAARWDVQEYQGYGIDSARRDRIIAAFAQWADEVDPSV